MEQREMQKKVLEIRMLEQQAKQFEEQIILVEQNVAQISEIQNNLDDIEKVKNQNILAPISRDVFIEAKAESAKSVLVSVGAGVVVRKTIEEAKAYMEKQKNLFLEARGKLSQEIIKIAGKMSEIESKIRG